MLSSLFAMAGFALAGAITPGPVNVLAMRHGSHSRRGCALLYVVGASVSYAVVVWIMGLFGQWLLRDPAVAVMASRVCAAYLLWLAWRIARAPVADRVDGNDDGEDDAGQGSNVTNDPRGFHQAFWQGAAIQSLNPKAWLVALSGVGLFVVPLSVQASVPHVALLAFCLVSLLACMAGVGCWVLLGNVLRRWLRTARRQRALNLVLAAVLLASVGGMLA
ncbi:LysE family translocator [Diaphorobacter sp. HDW4A]|uniref:LysE family translocator n=1 Tax=Diaphorobacter sp. HDW4A TaxID=2714924 RepID=UPI00140ACA52|nr:LysE family translocator [Diaphorobacter sp. HDW4A]QIL83570.1 LysE family translocator [Diaphorobacter sp. HDW4A]